MKRKYHGWIYREDGRGMKDYFSVRYRKSDGEAETLSMGQGEKGAMAAVEFFEKELGLGHVMLEDTPLGMRVFTPQSDALDRDALDQIYAILNQEPVPGKDLSEVLQEVWDVVRKVR